MKYGGKQLVKKYHSPIPKRVTTKIVYPVGENVHKDFAKYAKDFIVVPGTPIKIMEDGKVIAVKFDSDRYGLDKEFVHDVNYVSVEHKDGSIFEYLHLGKNMIYVKVGDKVKVGDILGLSGRSGYMSAPHVHVHRVKKRNGKYVGVPYDVEGVYDERAIGRSSRGSLEKIIGGIFIISIGIALLFFSGVTGNVVGVINNSFYGLIFVFVSLVFGGVWIFLKKRVF